jgi:hypothetical protein
MSFMLVVSFPAVIAVTALFSRILRSPIVGVPVLIRRYQETQGPVTMREKTER